MKRIAQVMTMIETQAANAPRSEEHLREHAAGLIESLKMAAALDANELAASRDLVAEMITISGRIATVESREQAVRRRTEGPDFFMEGPAS